MLSFFREFTSTKCDVPHSSTIRKIKAQRDSFAIDTLAKHIHCIVTFVSCIVKLLLKRLFTDTCKNSVTIVQT